MACWHRPGPSSGARGHAEAKRLPALEPASGDAPPRFAVGSGHVRPHPSAPRDPARAPGADRPAPRRRRPRRGLRPGAGERVVRPRHALRRCATAADEGAYPALEARVPLEIDGRPAASRDSGRFCAAETLGSVFEAGVTEVRFGGGIWEAGERGGIQLGAFEGEGLTPALLAEEYRLAASRRTDAVRATTLEIDGRPAWRIDVLDGSSRQAIVVWASADSAVVQAVVAENVEEAQLQAAIAAYR